MAVQKRFNICSWKCRKQHRMAIKSEHSCLKHIFHLIRIVSGHGPPEYGSSTTSFVLGAFGSQIKGQATAAETMATETKQMDDHPLLISRVLSEPPSLANDHLKLQTTWVPTGYFSNCMLNSSKSRVLWMQPYGFELI